MYVIHKQSKTHNTPLPPLPRAPPGPNMSCVGYLVLNPSVPVATTMRKCVCVCVCARAGAGAEGRKEGGKGGRGKGEGGPCL